MRSQLVKLAYDLAESEMIDATVDRTTIGYDSSAWGLTRVDIYGGKVRIYIERKNSALDSPDEPTSEE